MCFFLLNIRKLLEEMLALPKLLSWRKDFRRSQSAADSHAVVVVFVPFAVPVIFERPWAGDRGLGRTEMSLSASKPQ